MSEIIRKAAKGLSDLKVPKGLDGGVKPTVPKGEKPPAVVVDGLTFREGADEREVAKAAMRIRVRFDDALRSYRATKAEAIANGATPEVAEFRAQKQLDDVAEMVRRAGIEAKGGAVIADMASALADLGKSKDGAASLSMIMRRAGSPEVFQPIVSGELDDLPSQYFPDQSDPKRGDAIRIAQNSVALDSVKTGQTRKSLPMMYRPSSLFGRPDSVTSTGKVKKGSQAYKDFVPKNHGIDTVPTDRIIQDADTGEWREFDATKDAGREKDAQYIDGSDSSRKFLRDRLAGDQIRQVRAIEKKGMTPELPKVRTKKGEAVRGEQTLSTGTGESGQSQWGGRKRRPIDAVVDTASRGVSDRVREIMDRASRTGGKVDLDFVAPFARARLAELDDSGNISYPSALPSPEHITGMIIAMHNFPYESYDQWLDVVRRSYDDWPDQPSPKPGLDESSRSAADYSGMAFQPSASFKAVMSKGVGSPDYPHKIYGPRKVDRPEVTAPDTTPIQTQPTPEVQQETDDALRRIEEYRQKYSKKPGNDQVSSIYTMPSASPLGGLLA